MIKPEHNHGLDSQGIRAFLYHRNMRPVRQKPCVFKNLQMSALDGLWIKSVRIWLTVPAGIC